MLVQHILKLFLGSAIKSNELESKSVAVFPTNDGEYDDNRRPSLRSLHTKAQTGSDGKLNHAFDLTSGNREIGHRSLT